MKVSTSWLKELVDLPAIDKLLHLLPLRTIGLKEITPEFFELDMKGYNRADLLSMRGVAYEVSAITNSEVKFKEPNEQDYFWSGKNLPATRIEIQNKNLCSTYCIAKIEGLKIGPSSAELIKRLADCGMRTVNNVADITNLVMLEYGQPLHSFDAGAVKDETLIVRSANEGEELITLDNKKRKLQKTDLLIADPEKPVGLAGVMGGKNSEITDSTTTILLEAAIFDPINLRGIASRLNLQSEASRRFQHGLTKKRLLQAFDAAIRMYEKLGGKATAITLAGDLKDKERKITLTKKRLETIIGIQIKPEEVENYLERLNFQVSKTGEDWELTVPYFRLDIEIEDDVIEEIARMYGYEKIPAKELVGEIPKPIDQTFFNAIYDTKVTLAKLGLAEIQTYSFYSTQVLDAFNFEKDGLIKILNPMSTETEYLRSLLWPNLLEVVSRNLKNGIEDIAIFEIGKVYSPQKGNPPKEEYHLGIALSDKTDDPIKELSVIARNVVTKQSSSDQFQIKIAMPRQGGARNDDSKTQGLFHPTRFTKLLKGGKQIGFIAEVHPRIVNKFGTEKRIAVLDLKTSFNDI